MDKQIKNKYISTYADELKEDLTLTVQNLREKSLTCSAIRAKWLSYYYVEKENFTRAKNAKMQIIKKKSAESKYSDSVLRLKTEESISKNDETVQKLNKCIEVSQENMDYIERALTILNDFGFSIKNTIDILKMENC